MDDAPQGEFSALFEGCQHDLLRYVVGCVPSYSDALDILQETATALWLKFDQYDHSQPFAPWARKFAHIQVLKFCLYRQRRSAQFASFSQAAAAALEAEFAEHEQVLAARSAALAKRRRSRRRAAISRPTGRWTAIRPISPTRRSTTSTPD